MPTIAVDLVADYCELLHQELGLTLPADATTIEDV
jgi:hypothetical protein